PGRRLCPYTTLFRSHRAFRVRVLHERGEGLTAELVGAMVADDHLQAQRLGARAHDVDGLRVALVGDETDIAALAALLCALGQRQDRKSTRLNSSHVK